MEFPRDTIGIVTFNRSLTCLSQYLSQVMLLLSWFGFYNPGNAMRPFHGFLSERRYSFAKLRKFTDVCMVRGKFVLPTIQMSVKFRNFEELYLR